MTFQHSIIDEVHVLTPRKDLVGGHETMSLAAAIDELAGVGPARIVLDLGEISSISSLGLGSLKRCSTACAGSGGWLRLARVEKRIKNTLLVTGLIIYFDTFESVHEAAAAPARAPRSVPQNAS